MLGARLLGSAALLGVLVASAWGESALDILRKSIDARRNTLASLIQSQSLNNVPDDKIIMKIELDGKGRIRRTMLQPLRFQGQVMIDDGKNVLAFAPDEKQVRVVSTPSRPFASATRLELISKNYRLSARKTDPVAGRIATLITCRPVHRGMPWRRITVDQKTSLPLRIVSTLDGKATQLLDTLSFDEPRSMPDSLFQPPRANEISIIKVAGPIRVASEDEAENRLDFRPWVPRVIPMGFAPESIEVLPSALAIRLTDGFHSITLYQWDAASKSPGISGLGEADTFTTRGLRMAIFGDAPESVVDRLTESFKKESLAI